MFVEMKRKSKAASAAEVKRRTKEASVNLVRESRGRRRQGGHIMSLEASAEGTSLWLGRLDGAKPDLGPAAVMFDEDGSAGQPDNSGPRSRAWRVVASTMASGDDRGGRVAVRSSKRPDGGSSSSSSSGGAEMAPPCADDAAAALLARLLQSAHAEAVVGQAPGDPGWTLLHYAVAYDCRRCATLLLGAGAVPSAADRAGRTPLEVAKWFHTLRCAAIVEAERKRFADAARRGLTDLSVMRAFTSGGGRQQEPKQRSHILFFFNVGVRASVLGCRHQ